MNLTVQTDYAFRVLMFLAIRHPELATIQEISGHYGISRGHVMVLVHRLGALGFLSNTRGRGGGVRLARPASEIRLDEVARAAEPEFRLAECFVPDSSRCLIASQCRLRAVLGDGLAAFFEVLHRYTIADLVDRNHRLVRILDAERLSNHGSGGHRHC